MVRERKPKVAAYPQPWPSHVSIHDVFHFAIRENAKHLADFKTCCELRDFEGAEREIKMLRGIVDKMDAYRRIMLRNAAKESAANQTKEGVTI
jgi:hypothetical protein